MTIFGLSACSLACIATLLPACSESGDSRIIGMRQARLEQTTSPSCGTDAPARVDVSLRELAAGPVALRRDGSLQLELTSEEPHSLEVSLVVSAFIADRSARAELPPVHVDSSSEAVFEVAAQDLGLPSGDFEASGHFSVSGAVSSGRQFAAMLTELDLYFHPDREGWIIYDQTARDELYAGGALTEQEAALREIWRASPPLEGEWQLASFHAVRVSGDANFREADTLGTTDVDEVDR